MDLNKTIIFADTVFAQEVDGEMVLLDMESENYFGLDEVGTSIWQAMKDDADLDTVFAALLAQYEVHEDVLKSDLLNFVDRLQASGLVKVQAV